MGNIYTRKQLEEACLEYFSGDDLASEVWINKYAVKHNGNYLELTPEDMHQRLAKEFARIEDNYNDTGNDIRLSLYGSTRKALTEESIFKLFDHFRYVIPQGSVMAVLGNPYVIGSLSNCVVLPELYDSYSGILFADQQLVQLMKRRAGVGLDISALRPTGTPVSNAALTSSGAVGFMERFSNTTREVAQDGRRGALMITLDIRHPDAELFALVKQDLTKVTGANVSLRISDEFMRAVQTDSEFIQQWPIESTRPLITKKIKARALWNTILKCAHNTAEPGLMFWDRHHWYSTSSVYPQYKNHTSNPCGEVVMQGGDSCRLMALNLFGFVANPFTIKAIFDYEKFYRITYEAQRLMDDLVDLELESIEQILQKVEADLEPDYIKQVEKITWKILYKAGKEGRRTGLGLTGLADCLAALNLKFDSDEAVNVLDKIMRQKCLAEFDSSIDMAIQRSPFVGFDPIIENQSLFVKMLEKEFPNIYARMMKYGRRNVSISTVAPTGSLSILSQTSSGIEPVYTLAYKRRVKITPSSTDAKVDYIDGLGDKWREFQVYHPKFKQWMEVTGKTAVEEGPYYKATAEDIDWMKRVAIQSVIQKYTTHSISSTVNLPSIVTVERVGEIYMKAWELGLKGITVYRAGSRSGVLISNEQQEFKIPDSHAPKRPKILDAEVVRFINGGDKWIAFIGLVGGRPYEIFTGKQEDFLLPTSVVKGQIKKTKIATNGKYDFVYTDKDGVVRAAENLQAAFTPEFWNYAKFISMVLRHGAPLVYVIKVIDDLTFPPVLNSWKTGVSRALKKYLVSPTQVSWLECAICQSKDIIFEEGCEKCLSCGSSKCS